MSIQSAGVKGVGLAYHPLLHEVMLTRRFEFDFIELPLDLYLDKARSSLLDPEEARLREIAASKPCVWRGSELTLGSVEDPADPCVDDRTIGQIRRLLETTRAEGICEAIGFRRLDGHDLGLSQSLPYTPTAARWLARRHAAAREALGFPIHLQLAASSVAAPRAEWDAFTFLREIADCADCKFVLDVVDLAKFAGESGLDMADIARRLPAERVEALAISGDADEDWSLLSRLCGEIGAASIVVRRDKYLFPLDSIGAATRRAGEFLARGGGLVQQPSPQSIAPGPVDRQDLAALGDYQMELVRFCTNAAPEEDVAALHPQWVALAADVKCWQSWHARVEDTYKARQIRQFLAQDSEFQA